MSFDGARGARRQSTPANPELREIGGRDNQQPRLRRKKATQTRQPSPSPPRRNRDNEESFAAENALVKHRPKFIIDWRSEICQFLKLSTHVSDDDIFETLEEAEEKIRIAEEFEQHLTSGRGPPRSKVVYKIQCNVSPYADRNSIFLDEPWITDSGPNRAHLRGTQSIQNLDLYLERNKDISILIFQEYTCCSLLDKESFNENDQLDKSDLSSFFSREWIDLVSKDARTAMTDLAKLALDDVPHPQFDERRMDNIVYPYLWWFHRRDQIDVEKLNVASNLRSHIEVFQSYIHERLKHEWNVVEDLTSRGKITVELLRYIFVPGCLLISNSKEDASSQGLAARSWLEVRIADPDSFMALIHVTSWSFDGSFKRNAFRLAIDMVPVKSATQEFAISTLDVYPVRFAEDEIVSSLRNRGLMFWRCRHRNYVSYIKDDSDVVQTANCRFMVDIETYKKMHPANPAQPEEKPVAKFSSWDDDEVVEIDMQQTELPSEDSFLMCLPPVIRGFDMNKKEWRMLEVAFIREVEWNDQAFDHLVIDPATKKLVKAVVTNRLQSEQNADLIAGKGNGLFILLHGGPGTGKTLTAESVAEIARKPLYKVTCGDVGTKADEVEKYLEVVSLLGKRWGCVVLLDEADVFLEQRSLDNLERNALVSVFLRVLEYYDGIMILTSNRVGIFDEAFKSRIQLNLRYNNLGSEQKRKIWSNFIARLEIRNQDRTHTSQDHGIDAEQIRSHLSTLAQEDLNGREIRNAISTARQLASYENEPLAYKHLRSVIDEAKKFEDYLKVLHRGFSADEIQYDSGAR